MRLRRPRQPRAPRAVTDPMSDEPQKYQLLLSPFGKVVIGEPVLTSTGEQLRAMRDMLDACLKELGIDEPVAVPEGSWTFRHDEDCSVCEELRVVGPDHRNTLGADHDEGCSLA